MPRCRTRNCRANRPADRSSTMNYPGHLLSLLPCCLTMALASTDSVPGEEPENQQESDWVDARWNQTELGNFHASIVPLPNGAVAKGLSVRVGEHGEAAVVYDTASLILRAGWTGGFLKFNG